MASHQTASTSPMNTAAHHLASFDINSVINWSLLLEAPYLKTEDILLGQIENGIVQPSGQYGTDSSHAVDSADSSWTDMVHLDMFEDEEPVEVHVGSTHTTSINTTPASTPGNLAHISEGFVFSFEPQSVPNEVKPRAPPPVSATHPASQHETTPVIKAAAVPTSNDNVSAESSAVEQKREAGASISSTPGPIAQGINNTLTSLGVAPVPSSSTDLRPSKRRKLSANSSVAVAPTPTWLARATSEEFPRVTLANTQRSTGVVVDARGHRRVPCIFCGAMIGAGKPRLNTVTGQVEERQDTIHAHRKAQQGDAARRKECQAMQATGVVCAKGKRSAKQPFKYVGLPRLVLWLVKRYPDLLETQFAHDQIAGNLLGDLRRWLRRKQGLDFVMRSRVVGVDLAADELAAKV